MKIRRTITGISLLISSPLWGRVIEFLTGYSDVFGYVAITSVVAFAGGMIFLSGVQE